ncbi:alpha-glucosidase [Actinomyces slackii]|uniref:Glycosidase n=1 Tax=Actinomyces slackii TaxID=52774 RepID=A0A448KEM9_9ACTO|nr:alpha-glucosidase [Actinomyces slackii]VEG75417.1 Uncharacterised protein [Actinomyces slackii]
MPTTTTLVHRPDEAPQEWWRHGLVYELASPSLSAQDLLDSDQVLDHIVSLGLGGVLARPSLVDTASRGDMDAVRAFIARAHERDLRVVMRISGALGPVTGPLAGRHTAYLTGLEGKGEDLMRRAEAYLRAGAEGIDLGTIIPPEVTDETDLSALSTYFARLQALVAAHCDEGFVGADVTADYPDSLRHHLQEDWIHHLRDDCLTLVRWDAVSITTHLTQSLAEHARFGAPPAWRLLPSHSLLAELDPGDGMRWYSTDPEARVTRGGALQAMMLALPGVLYLRQGDEIAMVDADKPTAPRELADLVAEHARTQSSHLGSSVATIRHAAHVRRDHALATAPLAFVTGLDWCPPEALTLLARDVLVVVNLSTSPILLPPEARPLLASGPLGQDEGRIVLPETTTIWLEASTVA